jgi:hypothetical protein
VLPQINCLFRGRVRFAARILHRNRRSHPVRRMLAGVQSRLRLPARCTGAEYHLIGKEMEEVPGARSQNRVTTTV